jgi:SAM-dependent methyltransferase
MKEDEIRPEALLQRYRELSAQDATTCFAGTARQAVPCVACGEGNALHSFDKSEFAYAECRDCGTLFQNLRPPLEAFEAFYRESISSRYWADVFFPAVAEIRREKIFQPRVNRLAKLCLDKQINAARLIDVGAGFGIFLDEWRRLNPRVEAIAIEPSASMAKQCRAQGLTVVEDIVENVVAYNNSADLVTCFEVLEHVYDPLGFMRSLKNLTRPGGYVFISTLGIDGFDLQVLWEKSEQIAPPHHINFLSVKGFENLFRRAGLVDITVTTPGQLDVDIVRNAARRDPSILKSHRFLRDLIKDETASAAFQCFLADHRKSSHTWVIGRNPYTEEVK